MYIFREFFPRWTKRASQSYHGRFTLVNFLVFFILLLIFNIFFRRGGNVEVNDPCWCQIMATGWILAGVWVHGENSLIIIHHCAGQLWSLGVLIHARFIYFYVRLFSSGHNRKNTASGGGKLCCVRAGKNYYIIMKKEKKNHIECLDKSYATLMIRWIYCNRNVNVFLCIHDASSNAE